jgi:hypothetical protein
LLRVSRWCRQSYEDSGAKRLRDRKRELFPVHPLHHEPPIELKVTTAFVIASDLIRILSVDRNATADLSRDF